MYHALWVFPFPLDRFFSLIGVLFFAEFKSSLKFILLLLHEETEESLISEYQNCNLELLGGQKSRVQFIIGFIIISFNSFSFLLNRTLILLSVGGFCLMILSWENFFFFFLFEDLSGLIGTEHWVLGDISLSFDVLDLLQSIFSETFYYFGIGLMIKLFFLSTPLIVWEFKTKHLFH